MKPKNINLFLSLAMGLVIATAAFAQQPLGKVQSLVRSRATFEPDEVTRQYRMLPTPARKEFVKFLAERLELRDGGPEFVLFEVDCFPGMVLDLLKGFAPEGVEAANRVLDYALYGGYDPCLGRDSRCNLRKKAIETLAAIDPELRGTEAAIKDAFNEDQLGAVGGAVSPELVTLLLSRPPQVRRRFTKELEQAQTSENRFVRIAEAVGVLKLIAEAEKTRSGVGSIDRIDRYVELTEALQTNGYQDAAIEALKEVPKDAFALGMPLLDLLEDDDASLYARTLELFTSMGADAVPLTPLIVDRLLKRQGDRYDFYEFDLLAVLAKESPAVLSLLKAIVRDPKFTDQTKERARSYVTAVQARLEAVESKKKGK